MGVAVAVYTSANVIVVKRLLASISLTCLLLSSVRDSMKAQNLLDSYDFIMPCDYRMFVADSVFVETLLTVMYS